MQMEYYKKKVSFLQWNIACMQLHVIQKVITIFIRKKMIWFQSRQTPNKKPYMKQMPEKWNEHKHNQPAPNNWQPTGKDNRFTSKRPNDRSLRASYPNTFDPGGKTKLQEGLEEAKNCWKGSGEDKGGRGTRSKKRGWNRGEWGVFIEKLTGLVQGHSPGAFVLVTSPLTTACPPSSGLDR